MSDLLPCPFCGGEAKPYGPYGWYQQWCISHNCPTFYNGGSEGFKDYPSEAYAIAAWNTRSNNAPSLLEALQEVVEACSNTGIGNLVVNERVIDRCEEIACEAIARATGAA